MTETPIDRWTASGRWSEPVSFTRPPAPSTPIIGIYNTEIMIGGHVYPENHQLWVFEHGCRVLGVPVQGPVWRGAELYFTNQPDATRGGKPWAASARFVDDAFTGWCQFPGEGPVDWRGRRLMPPIPSGEWPVEILENGRWTPQPHPLRIAPGLIEIGGASISAPVFQLGGFRFADQPGAAPGGVPRSGSVLFTGDRFEGNCCFSGGDWIAWRSRAPSPSYGLYRTAVGYGGRWYDEDHAVEISGAGVRVAGIPVINATLGWNSLDFTNQPDASRSGKPWAGGLRFDGTHCTGWCQFPGEGPVDWRGDWIEPR